VARREILVPGDIHFGFARLHIQGAEGGAEQPFKLRDGRTVAVNGEIFNSEILVKQLDLEVPEGASDCAVVPALLERGMGLAEVARQLDGDFAIVVADPAKGTVELARDPYGVRPLFYGRGHRWGGVVSEIKGFPANAEVVTAVEPGTVMTVTTDDSAPISTVMWHQIPWLKVPRWRASLEGLTEGGQALRQALEEAVAKRLSTVRAVGACLSGGLDSSLVAAIAARRLARSGKRLHTYSIGMAGSPDLEHARLVAAHIGSEHHERIVTPEECLAAIPEVVRAIESFDITTVRASVGNYLVGRLVREETPDVKVVLNGDGADEALGGYLYMRAAPDDAAFEAETDRLLREIHMYDVARSERSMAAHGLESRSPFLDRQFIAVARGLPTDALRPSKTMLEKTILRTAFAEGNLLPEKVLWRRKEAFSDGISRAERSWFEMAREEGTARGTESGDAAGGSSWQSRAARFSVNPPPTAEALWYRELWSEAGYPEAAAAAVAPHMWMPRFVANATDPSARTLALYSE
jgi:asparagine synthase (glutamine-hydrolysing)